MYVNKNREKNKNNKKKSNNSNNRRNSRNSNVSNSRTTSNNSDNSDKNKCTLKRGPQIGTPCVRMSAFVLVKTFDRDEARAKFVQSVRDLWVLGLGRRV